MKRRTKAAHTSQIALEDVLITDELARRPSRSPDFRAENIALQTLARQMATDSDGMLETLAQMAVDLCRAGTSGVSLLETTPDGSAIFRWTVAAGELRPYVGGNTPRTFSPCGVTLDRRAVQLFSHPARYFTYFEGLSPPIVEGLVVPLDTPDYSLGTIWIVSHSDDRKFDWEDARVMTALAHFTTAALRLASAAAENARLYQESRAAMQVRDELIAGLAHDLKNPLTIITGYAQMLLQCTPQGDGLEGTPMAVGLTNIDQATMRLAAQIVEFEDVVHLQSGQPLEIRREPTDLVALAVELAAAHETTNGRQKIRVESQMPELVGRWDRVRLARVLDNLLNNAMKYSPDGSEIVVRLAREGGRAVLQVQDRGIGIPASELPLIFGRFYRASNVAGQIEGSGLGLAGARQIVEAHQGSIAVDSQEGTGTTVIVTLPFAGDDTSN